jgi:hypothetical protein
LQKEVSLENSAKVILDHGVKSWVGLPLFIGKSFWGALYLDFVDKLPFDDSSLSFLTGYARHVAEAFHRVQQAEASRYEELLARRGVQATLTYDAAVTSLATIMELLDSGQDTTIVDTGKIRSCIQAFFISVEAGLTADKASTVEQIDLDIIVREAWRQVSRDRYQPEFNIRVGQRLQWPRYFLGQILQNVFTNVLHILDGTPREPAHLSALTVKIEANCPDSDVFLDVWWSHPEFSVEETDAINAGLHPAGWAKSGPDFDLARAILRRASGRFGAESRPLGAGSMIWLSLPLVCPHAVLSFPQHYAP